MSSAPIFRRAVLGGAAAIATHALAPDGKAGAAAHPDARLIALHAAFDQLERQLAGLFDGPGAIQDDAAANAAADAIGARQAPLLDQLATLHATTLEGLAARARTMMLEDLELDPEALIASQFQNERLLGLVLRDLVDITGAHRRLA